MKNYELTQNHSGVEYVGGVLVEGEEDEAERRHAVADHSRHEHPRVLLHEAENNRAHTLKAQLIYFRKHSLTVFISKLTQGKIA